MREAGRLASSAFGLEPWRFIVVDALKGEDVARAGCDQPAVTTAATPIAIVALEAVLDPESECVRARVEAEARDGDMTSIYDTYRAFHRADSIAAWAQGQCNCAAARMGLDSGPVGGFEPDALAAALALPDGETPALLIALGHRSHKAPERLRKPLD